MCNGNENNRRFVAWAGLPLLCLLLSLGLHGLRDTRLVGPQSHRSCQSHTCRCAISESLLPAIVVLSPGSRCSLRSFLIRACAFSQPNHQVCGGKKYRLPHTIREFRFFFFRWKGHFLGFKYGHGYFSSLFFVLCLSNCFR